MKTKIMVVESEDIQDFQKQVNNANDLFNVFATQSHVTMVLDKLVYTAVIFFRC